jgi:GntR family transcriptional regulator
MLAAGTLRPGARLGSEREMAQRFAVSRSTLRSALLPLSQAGVLQRRTGRGGGTFVKSDLVQRNAAELAGLPARLRSGGHTSSTTVLDGTERAPTADEAAALRLAPGAAVIAVRRLRYADGVPLSLDLACFAAAMVPDLLRQALDGSLYELLRIRYGLVPDSATETIEVVAGSPAEAGLLDVPTRRPLLAITRIARDAVHGPFEYSTDLFRADRVRLTANTSTLTARERLGSDGRVELSVSGG